MEPSNVVHLGARATVGAEEATDLEAEVRRLLRAVSDLTARLDRVSGTVSAGRPRQPRQAPLMRLVPPAQRRAR